MDNLSPATGEKCVYASVTTRNVAIMAKLPRPLYLICLLRCYNLYLLTALLSTASVSGLGLGLGGNCLGLGLEPWCLGLGLGECLGHNNGSYLSRSYFRQFEFVEADHVYSQPVRE